METSDEHLKSIFTSLDFDFSNVAKITPEVVLTTAGKLLSNLGIAPLLLVEMDRYPIEMSKKVIAVSIERSLRVTFVASLIYPERIGGVPHL